MFFDSFMRVKLLFHKDKELYHNLKNIMGFFPHNIEIYKIAFAHKSFMLRNNQGRLMNNERLEFLGDAILGAVVGHIVFKHFPNKSEGFLTTTRSKLVQREMLGKISQEIGIDKVLLTSKSSASHNSYIGGNAFEALVGAIYIDRGYDICMKFIEKKILSKLINIDKVANEVVNFKSKLLEWAQKKHLNIIFELTSEEIDNNGNPTFEHIVKIENIEGCRGKGYSKKESQQNAARLTLEKLQKDKFFYNKVLHIIKQGVG